MYLVVLYLAPIFDLWMIYDGTNSARNEQRTENRPQILFATYF